MVITDKHLTNRLIRENNPALDKTIIWSYNALGNRTEVREYAYTTATSPTGGVITAYIYGNDWKQLIVLSGTTTKTISYDSAGNPTNYKGATLTWTRGRLLASYKPSGSSYTTTMQYDANGVRCSKTIPTSTQPNVFRYVYDGNNLVRETKSGTSSYTKTFLYNSQGIIGFAIGSTVYTYRKNLFGDIIAIYQGATKKAAYLYDAWGNCTITQDTDGIGTANPFRYRGYYWDNDLQLYYLMSRYYDPTTGRFINADGLEYLEPETIGGLNLYAYCANNPVMYADPSGHVAILTLLIGALIGAAVSFASSVISQSTTDDKEINWGQVALDTIIGGISGALGASGVTRVVSIVAGGILGVVGSIGGDLIASNGDWSKVNIGKAALMGTIGAVAGRFTGAGAQNTKAMNGAINAGKSWGSKAFLKSAEEAAIRPNSGLVLQTMYMNMAKAISKYTVQAVFNVSLATFGTTFLGNAISW